MSSSQEISEPDVHHECEFEPMAEDPYHERCTCGAKRELSVWADGEFA